MLRVSSQKAKKGKPASPHSLNRRPVTILRHEVVTQPDWATATLRRSLLFRFISGTFGLSRGQNTSVKMCFSPLQQHALFGFRMNVMSGCKSLMKSVFTLVVTIPQIMINLQVLWGRENISVPLGSLFRFQSQDTNEVRSRRLTFSRVLCGNAEQIENFKKWMSW